MKQSLTPAVFESQMVLDLPERELLGVVELDFNHSLNNNEILNISNFLNHSLNNNLNGWKVLNGNEIDVTVSPTVNIQGFCAQAQVLVVFGLQRCSAKG
jgi:hypothetical protein